MFKIIPFENYIQPLIDATCPFCNSLGNKGKSIYIKDSKIRGNGKRKVKCQNCNKNFYLTFL